MNLQIKAQPTSTHYVGHKQLQRAFEHGEDVGFEKWLDSDRILKMQAFKGNQQSIFESMMSFCEVSSEKVEQIFSWTKNYNSFDLLILIPEEIMFGEGFHDLCSKVLDSQNALRENGIFITYSFIEKSDNLNLESINSDGYELIIKKSYE